MKLTSEIINYYGRLEREPIEFQVNWHYIKKYLPRSGYVLDNGAGPGKYSIELAKDGYYVTLTDLLFLSFEGSSIGLHCFLIRITTRHPSQVFLSYLSQNHWIYLTLPSPLFAKKQNRFLKNTS